MPGKSSRGRCGRMVNSVYTSNVGRTDKPLVDWQQPGSRVGNPARASIRHTPLRAEWAGAWAGLSSVVVAGERFKARSTVTGCRSPVLGA